MVNSLARHRRLAWELTKRELVDRYVGQVAGTFWAVIQPALTICIFIVLFGMVFTPRIATGQAIVGDQLVYLISGLVPWMAIQDALARAPGIIVSNAALVKQVSFPLSVLPVKSLLPSFIILPIGHGLLLLYVLVQYGSVPATWSLLPICWAMLILAGIGLAYALSAIAVYFRDIGNIVQLSLFIGLYVSPVFYRPDAAPGFLRVAMLFNPITYIIFAFQDATNYGSITHPAAWAMALGLSVASFLLGARVFNILQRQFGTFL